MSIYDHHISKQNINDYPSVLINTPDDGFVKPLREYFESNKYHVTINDEVSSEMLYHIIAGDIQYVKHIIAQLPSTLDKRLFIIWNIQDEDLTNVPFLKKDKIFLNPPDLLLSRDVSEILLFFFTSATKVFNYNKVRIFPNETKKVQDHLSTVHNNDGRNFLSQHSFQSHSAVDQKRISDILHSVYLDSRTSKVKITKKSSLYKKNTIMATNRSPFRFFLAWIVKMCFKIYLISVLWSFIGIFVAGFLLLDTTRSLESGNLLRAKIATVGASVTVNSGALAAKAASYFLSSVGLNTTVRNQERIFVIYKQIIQSVQSSISIYKGSQELSENILASPDSKHRSTVISIPTALQKILADISYIKTNISLSGADLRSMTEQKVFPFSYPSVRAISSKITNHIGDIRRNIIDLEKILELYEGISGFAGERTYLVLLQNSAELRPTGGFIGSLGIAKFFNGSLLSFEIQDVYDIDGQLKGHVDPPPLIHTFLGQEHWYLRDSNWDPDFSVSGQRAAWFYEKSTGTHVDGVFAVTSLLLVDILNVVGPVDLPDYNDHITAENFFGKSLFYTHKDFFAGSSQKKDFLGSLVRSLVNNMYENQKSNSIPLFRALGKGLSEKNILFYVEDPQIMARVHEYGWGGELRPGTGCEIELDRKIACFSDYFHKNEANLSINKVNNFINQETVQSVNISESGTIGESVAMTYTNTSRDGISGGGTYIPYIRIYIPKDSVLQAMLLDGTPMARNDGTGNTGDIPYYSITQNSTSAQILGIVFRIEPLSSRQIFIRYEMSRPFEFFENNGVYELLLQKQPGIKGSNILISLSTPSHWRTSQEPPGVRNNIYDITAKQSFLAKEGKLEYNGDLSRDIRFKVYVSK